VLLGFSQRMPKMQHFSDEQSFSLTSKSAKRRQESKQTFSC
jgi:hypothetical protein